jgi:competence protein ComEC
MSRSNVLIVSHGDNDHIGGAEALLQRFPVAALYTGAPGRPAGFNAIPCQAGQEWNWDGVDFRMLGPLVPAETDNDNSCVLRVSGVGGSVLLTGDIEAEAERRLVQSYGDGLASDVLLAPHHGSKTSSTRGFLEAVRPGHALIPAGYLNRFGFPHPAVLRRYAEFWIKALNTAEAGAVTVAVSQPPGGMRIDSFRQEQRRYWNEP